MSAFVFFPRCLLPVIAGSPAGFTDALRAELAGSGVFVGTVHPGVIRSNFLERAQWYGAEGQKSQALMESMVGGGGGKGAGADDKARAAAASAMGGILQSPEEVAAAVFEMATRQQASETVVGPFFATAVQAYRFTGLNPFDAA